jgi:uncharacterized RDD family membrane protein YckC
MDTNRYAPPNAPVDQAPLPADEFEYAGFWIRLAASLIDTVCLLAITMPLLVAIYGWAYFDEGKPFVQGPADAALTWLAPALASILFWLTKQATPGKMLVSARVVDARTGGTLSVGQSIGRYLGYYLSAVPLGLGFIWVAFDPRKQGWHDKLAGTVVVRAKGSRAREVRFEER